MKLKPFLIKLHWILSTQVGFDPRVLLRSVLSFPFYISSWIAFRKYYLGVMKIAPCLQDRCEEAGVTKSEYFWQDLLVARAIFLASPRKHVDIGSRIDNFVAHVASFREIEVFDVRPISTTVPGIVFHQIDMMDDRAIGKIGSRGYCDSISCLHAIEHFGLGRYGDPINLNGYEIGIKNIAKLLEIDGFCYISTPIGKERVEFNANWIFDPRRIVSCAKEAGLILEKLIIITSVKPPEEVPVDERNLEKIAMNNYCLGLFILRKKMGK
jgi:hypothetical protein